MKRFCAVCGFSIENDNIKECPNCGSFDLRTIQYGIRSGIRSEIRSEKRRFRRF